MRRLLLLLIPLCLFTGCEMRIKRKMPPLVFDNAWQTDIASTVNIDSQWWEQLQDPTLNALVAEALQNSISLKVAQQRVVEAQENTRVFNASLLPQIDLVASVSDQRTGVNLFGTELINLVNALLRSFTEAYFTFGFKALWEIDLFGERRALLRSAIAEAGFRKAELEGTKISLAAEVTSTYLSLKAHQQLLEEGKNGVESLRSVVVLESQKQKSGLLSPGVTLSQESQLAAAEATLSPLVAQIEQLCYRLSTLLGKPPEYCVNLCKGLDRSLITLPAPSIGIRSELLRNRPDIRAAEYLLCAAWALEDAALAKMFPNIILAIGRGQTSTDYRTLLENDSRSWLYGSEIGQPFFRGGGLVAEKGVEKARGKQAYFRWRQVVIDAFEETEGLLSKYAAECQREDLLKLMLGKSEDAYNEKVNLNDAGLLGHQSIHITKYALSQQKQSLINAELSRQLIWVALHRAVAGPIQP